MNIILILRLKNDFDLVQVLREICAKSIYLVYFKVSKSNKIILDFVTNSKEFMNIIDDVLFKYANEHKIIYLDYHKSKKYWGTKNWLKLKYHELFDPKTTNWRFEIKKYLAQLKLLSPAER